MLLWKTQTNIFVCGDTLVIPKRSEIFEIQIMCSKMIAMINTAGEISKKWYHITINATYLYRVYRKSWRGTLHLWSSVHCWQWKLTNDSPFSNIFAAQKKRFYQRLKSTKRKLGGGFKRFVIFTATWGKDPIWLIFLGMSPTHFVQLSFGLRCDTPAIQHTRIAHVSAPLFSWDDCQAMAMKLRHRLHNLEFKRPPSKPECLGCFWPMRLGGAGGVVLSQIS